MISSQATLSVPKARVQFTRLAGSVWLQALGIGLLAFAFMLYHLGNASLWTDEAFSVNVARMSLAGVWQTFTGGEVNMVLYYALLHFWLGLVSALGLQQTEFLIRVPSAFFAALAAASVYLLAQRFLGLLAAIAATGVFLFNQQQLLAAQEARSYSMQVFLVVVMWGCFLTLLLRQSGRGWWAGYILSSVLASYAHAISALVLVTQAGIFALLLILPTPYRPRARELFRPMLVSFAVILALVLPLGLVSGGAAKVQWLSAPHPRDVVHAYMVLGPNSSKTFLAFVLVLAIAAGASFVALRGRDPAWFAFLARWRASASALLARVDERAVLLAALILWAVVPLILAYFISQIGPSYRYFSDAHLVMLVPALGLLLAFAATSIPWRPAAWGAGVAIVAIMALTLPQYFGLFREDWRTPVQWVQQRYQPNDGALCEVYAAETCNVPMFHYYPTDDPAVSAMLAGAPQNVDDAALAAYAAQHPHLFFIIGSPTNDAAATQQRAVESWLDAHYRLVTQYLGWIIVREYDTTAGPNP